MTQIITRKRLLALVALLAIAAVLAATPVFFTRSDKLQTITLPDGTVLTLDSVTYGKSHCYTGGPLWARLLAPLARWTTRLFKTPALPSGLTTTNDSLCCWLLVHPINTANRWVSMNWVLSDEAGHHASGVFTETWLSLPGGETIRGFCFANFPRREPRLLLRNSGWNNTTGKQEVSETITLQNPGPRRFANWKASPPPITGRDGDLEVTLTRLLGGVHRNVTVRGLRSGQTVHEIIPATNAIDVAAVAGFRFRQGGQVVTNWEPVGLELADATGNVTRSSSWSGYSEEDQQFIHFQWGLGSDEPAWRMQAEFSRTSGFAAEEQWAVQGISTTNIVPEPPPGAAYNRTNFLLSTNLLSSRIELASLRERAGYRSPLARVALAFRVRPEPAGRRLTLVSVTDETGRPLKRSGSSWGSGDYQFDLENLTGVTSLSFVVAFHRNRFVEFLARPAQAK